MKHKSFMIKNSLKVIILLLISFIIYLRHLLFDDKKIFYQKYSTILKTLNYNEINKKLRIAVYVITICGGGRARMTALLTNYLHKIKIFKVYLFTNSKKKNDYINI